MKLLIQRVQNAEVSVDGEIVGKIGKGFLVLCTDLNKCLLTLQRQKSPSLPASKILGVWN